MSFFGFRFPISPGAMISRAVVFCALLTTALHAVVSAAPPTCVMMKFTDDTRYDQVHAAENLSKRLMKKMIASGRFNLTLNTPIDRDMEAMLYDEKVRELSGIKSAIAAEDFDALFEGPGFSEKKAQSIATASVGQIVTPEITRRIGEETGAQFLVQGTIINLGVGNWWEDENYPKLSAAINTATSLLAMPIASALGGSLGPIGDLLTGGIDIRTTGIGVQSDVRIIKAATGEVVWSRRLKGIDTQKLIGLGLVSIGTEKLSENIYENAMEKMSQNILNAMIADMDEGKLFN